MTTLIMCITPFDLLMVFAIVFLAPLACLGVLVTAIIVCVRVVRARTVSLNLDDTDGPTRPAHAR